LIRRIRFRLTSLARSPEVFLPARRALLLSAVSVLVCALPLLLLFDLRSVFDSDWFNHLWIIEYFGEYIRQHGTPPAVLSTANLVGIVAPLFYAEKFYLFTGIISSFLGSAAAFRIVAFVSLLIQFWHIERATRQVNRNKAVSMIVATIVTWAIYPLTNLYNRSALTEFIAVTYLNSAISCLFVLLLRNSRGEKSYYDAVAVGFLFAIAALTHPLTAAFGGSFLICIGASFLSSKNKLRFAAIGLINATLVAAVLSPWLYLLHKYSDWLPINQSSANAKYFQGLLFPLESINNLWSLLSPVALDLRTLKYGMKDVSTPFLDAQINLPLIIIGLVFSILWTINKKNRSEKNQSPLFAILIVSLSLFSLFLSVATNPNFSTYLGGVFDILQFPYRLTTYLNLALLTFLLAAAGLSRNINSSNSENIFFTEAVVFGISLGISLSGVVTKLIHANATRFVNSQTDLARLAELDSLPAMPDSKRNWIPASGPSSTMLGALPTTFYWHSQYTVLEGYLLVPPNGMNEECTLQLVPGTGKKFGEVPFASIALKSPTLVVTNIQPFPWNQIFVNDHQKKRGDLVVLAENWASARGPTVVLAVPLPSGKYTIEYQFRPDKAWRLMECISVGITVVWFIVWLVSAALGAFLACSPLLCRFYS
jgi:hypothetical protein